jgi:hypothetical protein
MTGRIEKNPEDAIGTITFKKRSAERKYAEIVLWEGIPQSAPVFNYDSIRTFEGSAATIKLKNGAEITLNADTMILLVADSKGVRIDFDKGSLSAKNIEGSSSAIKLQTRDSSISVQGPGGVSLTGSKSSTEVTVASGSAVIESGGTSRSITSSESAVIRNGAAEIKKLTLIPESPDDSAYFVSFREKDSIDFRWRGSSPGKTEIRIASDPDFKNIVLTAAADSGSYRALLPAGEYYWRTESGDDRSPSRKFTILKDSYPAPLYPADNSYAVLISADEAVSFRWRPSAHAVSYKLEIASDSNMKKTITELTAQLDTARALNLPEGDLRWRVTPVYPPGFIALSGFPAVSSVNIERRKAEPVRPKLIPPDGITVSTAAENFILNWETSRGAESYTVEISPDREFKKITKSESTSDAYYKAEQLPEGIWYWRAAALYPGNVKAVSETAPIRVTAPAPVKYLSPAEGAVIYESEETIRFSWSDPAASGTYTIEYSSDPSFTKTIHSGTTESSSYSMKNPGNGKYYWRVSTTAPGGSVLVRAKPASFSVPEYISAPEPMLPASGASIDIDTADSIRFQWKPVDGADAYELRLFQRTAGIDRPLISNESAAPSYDLKNFSGLKTGAIFWTVRAKKNASGKTAVSEESRKNYFTLKATEELPAPAVTAPDRIYVK